MLVASLRSILNAPPSILWAKHFYKSKAFVTPDAPTIPPLDKFMDLALGSSDLGGTTFYYQREMNDLLSDRSNIQSVEGHWLPEGGGISTPPMNAAERFTVEGLQRPLSFQSPSTSSQLSSDQSSIFSHIRCDCRDSTTSITTNTTSSNSSIHVSDVPGWPRAITPLTVRDVISLRLAGEMTSDSPSATPTSAARMKAIAGWVTGFIYAQIAGTTSARRPAVGTYNTDVHVRVTDRIQTVLESTSLPPPTVILALWYTSQFPFAVSAADDDGPRDVFYRLLCGYGAVHIEDTIFLAFITGAMLADKANNDFPLSAKEWHIASLYEISDLKFLQFSALKLFGWNVVIYSLQWDQWMAYITAYHSVLARYQAISRDYGIIACMIDRVNRRDPHWNCDCGGRNTSGDSPLDISTGNHVDANSCGRSPPTYSQSQSHSLSLSLPDLLYSTQWQLAVDPIIYPPSQAVCNVTPSVDREPAPWCPAADPIVETAKTARTMGTAPGSTWIKPVAASDILENITARRYPGASRYHTAEAVCARSPPPYRGIAGQIWV